MILNNKTDFPEPASPVNIILWDFLSIIRDENDWKVSLCPKSCSLIDCKLFCELCWANNSFFVFSKRLIWGSIKFFNSLSCIKKFSIFSTLSLKKVAYLY